MTTVPTDPVANHQFVPGNSGTSSSQGSQTPAHPGPLSKVAQALKFISEEYEYISNDGRTYAAEKSSANPQASNIDSPGFGSMVRRLVHTKNPSLLLTDEDLKEVRAQLKALADVQGINKPVWLRVADVAQGIELDLADKANTRVLIRSGKVQVSSRGSKTLFYRTPNIRPFVIPAKRGDLNKLLAYLNLTQTDKWLLIAWITYTLAHPKVSTTNYVILALRGERGSGKSSMNTIILRSLLDPSVIGVQSFPTKIGDLAIAAQNSHVLLYDNLRHLTTAQSDALCIASTSGYLLSRMLYTDDQESVKKLHCAMVLNGIHPFIEEPDLAQRSLVLHLQRLDRSARLTESHLAKKFSQDLPVIFRGLLDLIANIFKNIGSVKPVQGERMLDFVHWLTAMENALGVQDQRLQRAYSQNLVDCMQAGLEEDPLAITIIRFAKKHGTWSDTPRQLYSSLSNMAGPQVANTREWPANEIALSLRLRKLRSKLSGAGVDVQIGKSSRRRHISIFYTGRSS